MGAENFSTSARGKTMREAYTDAYQQAEYEHGHDAYNGTISTTNGFVDKTEAWIASGKELHEWEEEMILDDKGPQKWGPAWGVETSPGVFYFFGWAAC